MKKNESDQNKNTPKNWHLFFPGHFSKIIQNERTKKANQN